METPKQPLIVSQEKPLTAPYSSNRRASAEKVSATLGRSSHGFSPLRNVFDELLVGGLGVGGADGFEAFAGGFDGALDVGFGVGGGNEERLELRRREKDAAR
jgi:hypothetical protein